MEKAPKKTHSSNVRPCADLSCLASPDARWRSHIQCLLISQPLLHVLQNMRCSAPLHIFSYAPQVPGPLQLSWTEKSCCVARRVHVAERHVSHGQQRDVLTYGQQHVFSRAHVSRRRLLPDVPWLLANFARLLPNFPGLLAHLPRLQPHQPCLLTHISRYEPCPSALIKFQVIHLVCPLALLDVGAAVLSSAPALTTACAHMCIMWHLPGFSFQALAFSLSLLVLFWYVAPGSSGLQASSSVAEWQGSNDCMRPWDSGLPAMPCRVLTHKPSLLANQPGIQPYKPGVLTHLTRLLTHQPSIFTHIPGLLADQPGVFSHQSGVLPHQSGVFPHQPGLLTHFTGILANQPGL